MVQCLLEGKRKYFRKPVSHEKVKEVTQEKEENAALHDALWRCLESLLTEAPSLLRGNPCWDNISSASLPLISGKTPKVTVRPTNPYAPARRGGLAGI